MAAVLHELDGTNGDEDALELGGDTANCCDDLESDEAEEVQRRRELGQGDVDYGGELEAELATREGRECNHGYRIEKIGEGNQQETIELTGC
jgi:hypothetical protein